MELMIITEPSVEEIVKEHSKESEVRGEIKTGLNIQIVRE